MRLVRAILLLAAPLALKSQTPIPSASPCENTPAYSTCDVAMELAGADAAAHPDPYTSVELMAELRSPNMRTYGIPAFWDGGRRMVLRFAPTEAGRWEYRLTSNIAAWNGKTGTFTAIVSDSPGFVAPANVHHWAYSARNQPHLWMGVTEPRFAFVSDDEFQRLADARLNQKFNHLRGLVLGDGPDRALSSAGVPDLRQFARLDARVRYWNQKGGIVDLVLAPNAAALARALGTADVRRRFLRYLVGRYAAMNVTWELAASFENDRGSRAILDDTGKTLKELDSYRHPLTTGAEVTAGPLLDGGWMDFLSYGTSNPSIGAIEHQLYQQPAVARLGGPMSGAGNSGPSPADAAELRHRLWDATMNGQYPAYQDVAAGASDAPAGAKAMTVWFDFMLATRHWDLEPYFDLDGGRALALPDVEYIVYVNKPGPVELTVAHHTYDVIWMDPADGTTQKRKYSGEHFVGEPPDRFHDWVLHVVREGTLGSMNRSYRFESRDVPIQEIQVNPEKVPFEIDAPSGDLAVGKAAYFSAKLKRASRGTRDMLWLWTCEVTEGHQGYRVIGTSQQGTFYPLAGLAIEYPAVLLLRVYGINNYGTVYMSPKGFGLNQ